jgi:hypothetical protein
MTDSSRFAIAVSSPVKVSCSEELNAHTFGGQLAHDGADSDNGLERFITATRRQNFFIPPRRHRTFPSSN